MKRRLVFSPAAERDLEEILSFISRDRPGAATRFVARLRAGCQPLTGHPLVGEDASDLRPTLRRFVVESYVIFFRLRGDDVEVVRVIHGARDWTSLLKPES